MRQRRIRAWIAGVVLLSGATVSASDRQARYDDLLARVAARGLDAEVLQPLYLRPEIKDWAFQRVPRGGEPTTRLKNLFEMLQHEGFEYEAGYTGTVEEVFATRKFNCLSFSMLFVALAREMALPAYFLNVRQIQSFERDGDLVVVSGHITAGYGFVDDRTVLEFSVGPEINYKLGEPISDLEALALYYSNRGAEMMREGASAEAIEQLETAVVLGPKLAQTWVNLGVARRRAGDLAAAERAYKKAIELDARNLPAYQNLAAVLRLRGEHDAAGRILDLLEERKNRNPFTHLALGDWSLHKGKVDSAERFFRRALRLARHEAEPHAAMGQWALAVGDRAKARVWLRRARAIDEADERTLRLAEMLDGAGARP